MIQGSDPTPPEGNSDRISRRRFIARAGAGAAGCLALGGGLSRCSSSGPDRPVARPPAESAVIRPPIPAREPIVRVRIGAVRPDVGDPRRSPPTLESDTGWLRVREADSGHHGLILRSPVTLERDEFRWNISDPDGYEPLIDNLSAVEVLPDGADVSGIRYDGGVYPGTLRLVARTDESYGAFDIVNHLALETYLPGVLQHELFSHWHDEAFAAQAIAARSFACVEIHHYQTRRHFDVTNTQRSQVYGGATDAAKPRSAAQRTRGMVLGFDNALVPGYYSSCCGGVAANAADAIGPNPINAIAPLQSRNTPDACRNAPVYRWELDRSTHELSRRLNAYGVHSNDRALSRLGMLASIRISRTNPHGRPTMFELRDAGTTVVELPASRIIDALDFAAMGLGPPEQALRSSFISVEVRGDRTHISGRGFGHGVGLCQYGAQQLATEGIEYRRILSAYYPGSSIVAAYL